MAPNIHFLFSGLIFVSFLGIRNFYPGFLSDFHVSHAILWVFFANILLFLFWKTWLYPTFLDPLRYLPEPKGGRPFLRFAGILFKRPPSPKILEWINNIPNDGIIRVPGFFGRHVLIPTTPKILSELLVTKSYDFEKPEKSRNILRLVLGEGLVIAEGDIHRFQRKNLNPLFNFRHIKDLYPLMWEKAVHMTQCVKIETESTFSVDEKNSVIIEANQWASRATLDIIGVAALGRNFDSLRNTDDELVQVYEWLFEPTRELQLWFAANLIFPRYFTEWLPWKVEREVASRSIKLRQICREFVQNKREAMKAETVQSVDILGHLIRSNNFSDDELVDQVLTFLAAGHETTSSAFTWVLHLLAKYQNYQTTLRNELRTALGSSMPNTKDISSNLSSILDSLPYLNAICAETLRIYPSVPSNKRVAARDTTLGSNKIPAGTQLVITNWQMNRAQHLWGPRAEEFWPERWIDFTSQNGKTEGKFNNHGGSKSNYALLTFIHGPRSCIGQSFAKNELKALVAAWVLAFQFEMKDPLEEVVPFGMVTMKPKNGLYLRVTSLEE